MRRTRAQSKNTLKVLHSTQEITDALESSDDDSHSLPKFPNVSQPNEEIIAVLENEQDPSQPFIVAVESPKETESSNSSDKLPSGEKRSKRRSSSPDFFGLTDDDESDGSIESVTPQSRGISRQVPTGAKGGRVKDKVWGSGRFDLTRQGNKLKAFCKSCNKPVSAKAGRLKTHLKTCFEYQSSVDTKTGRPLVPRKRPAPVSTSAAPASASAAPASTSVAPASAFVAPASAFVAPVPGSSKRQRTSGTLGGRFCDSMSAKDQEHAEKLLSKYFFSSNTAFLQIENPWLREFLRFIRPSFKVPDRKKLGNEMLDTIHQEVQNDMKNELEDKTVTMLQDGWSTCQNAPVVAHSLTTGFKHYFIKATGTEDNRKTAEFCTNLLVEAKDFAESNYGCKVDAVCTDNCNVMQAMRRNCEEKLPGITTIACAAHVLNLLGQALTPTDLTKQIAEVQAFFRGHHYDGARLQQLGGIRPVTAVCTRWNSQIASCESYIRNHTKYMEISRDPKSEAIKTKKIVDIITNNSIYERANSVISMLRPVSQALTKLQAENAVLPDVVHQWLGLEEHLFVYKEFDTFNDKWRPMICTPAALASYCLHPKYRGNKLNETDIETAHTYLGVKCPDLVTVAFKLKINSKTLSPASLFSDRTVNELSPSEWWLAAASVGFISQTGANFAKNLMSYAATAAGIERCFSVLGQIQSKRRNKLGIGKSEKLCTVYMQLKCYDYDSDGED